MSAYYDRPPRPRIPPVIVAFSIAGLLALVLRMPRG